MKRILTVFILSVIALCVSAADLKLARHFSDHMVLQREKPTVVRGQAAAGAAVNIVFAGQKKSGKADDTGNWEIILEALQANAKPAEMTVTSGGKKVIIKDVVVGDVIFFGRQTCIDISLGRDASGQKAAAAHRPSPKFRAISLLTLPAVKPLNDLDAKVTSGWKLVDKASALKMSGAAYHLGRDLAKTSDVPIGIIDVNMGWFFPMAWLSRERLMEPVPGSGGVGGRVKRQETLYEAFSTGKPFMHKKKEIKITVNPMIHPLSPAVGYNGTLLPLRDIGLKGVIVQIGNDYPYMYYEKIKSEKKNTDRVILNDAYVKTYDIRKEGFRMEPSMITRLPKEWRKALGDEALPMAFVNPPSSDLSVYAAHNIEMREIQRRTALDNKPMGIILPGMEGIPFSGQPRDEALLGYRCANWVKGVLFNDESTPGTGPIYDRFEGEGSKVTIYYKEGTARGLKASKGSLDCFEAADVDSVYVPAKAVIDGETIKLTCKDISRIFYIRYNWRTKPDEGLVNSAGLPAQPFRTEKASHRWLVRYKDDDLSEEYYTPANKWKGGAVTLINGQLMRVGYMHFSGWLGPVGVKTGPFGPNMGIKEVKKGSPAYGKLFVGDVIYSANGKMLGDDEEMTMAAAITHSEAEDGKLLLGVHRDGKNLDVEVQLKVMGRYSATSPWNCLKSERIVSDLEEYLARRGAPSGFLTTDAMFLLGAGSPKYQWLVRKTAQRMKGGGGGNNWALGYATQYLSEYYLATGDKSVLPGIKAYCDTIAKMQIREDGRRNGGWYGRGNSPRKYPAMAHTGVSAMLGLTLAKECGVKVDPETFERGLAYLKRKGAPVGQIIYGDAFRDRPNNIDPKQMLAGKLHTANGKIPEAAVLYELLGDRRSAYINSNISTHAWYSTYGGHGGHFWDQYWTPLGSAVHSKEAYIYFMKGHRWFRECNRMFDGSHITGGKAVAATGLALVVPRRRLRILGAAKSPFSPGAPDVLKPALDAYYARDYKKAEELARAAIAAAAPTDRSVSTMSKLAEEAKRMKDCIDSELSAIAALSKEGRLHEAKLIMASLSTVITEKDPRLAAAQKQLSEGKARPDDAALYAAALRGGTTEDADESKAESAADLKKIQEQKMAAIEDLSVWECLTPKEFVPSRKGKPSKEAVAVEQAAKWRFTVLEHRDNAPDGWEKPGFDDSEWTETTQPVSWHLNHVTVHRTTFNVKDKKTYDLLKFKGWVFRQQNVAIYLNGVLIGRINNIEKKTGTIEVEFKKAAMGALKDGENTIAIATRQNWRWGMLSMRVYNDGFDFMLFGRLEGVKKEPKPKKAPPKKKPPRKKKPAKKPAKKAPAKK